MNKRNITSDSTDSTWYIAQQQPIKTAIPDAPSTPSNTIPALNTIIIMGVSAFAIYWIYCAMSKSWGKG